MEYYYHPDLFADYIKLSMDESGHLKVLHRKKGDAVFLSDGKGIVAKAIVVNIEKEGVLLSVIERNKEKQTRNFTLHIAIAPTKNRDRIEWFVEKAVEIGIEQITLIICEHSERSKIDIARLERITMSAMKQSQSAWIPRISCCSVIEFMQNMPATGDKFIAWCGMDLLTTQLMQIPIHSENITILIGPEGDFSSQEIAFAKEHHFKEVLLGNKRLRTETAGLYASVVIAARKGN